MKFNKALVIGDLIIDKYVYGEVKRISPEAPVPVLNSNKFFTSLGCGKQAGSGPTAMPHLN